MIKYIFLNILKSKKLYISFFIIILLTLFILMCSFSVRENILSAGERSFGKYAAVAITTNNDFFNDPEHSHEWVNINEVFIRNHLIQEHIVDYYAFSEYISGSNMIESIFSDTFSILAFEGTMPFNLMVYSEISKSTHFRLGDRRIIEGRFAKNTSECIISVELAELNGLSIDDYIEIYLYFYNPQYFTLKIVGIYEDNTDEVTNELVLVEPNRFILDDQGGDTIFSASYISGNNISRNQILTSAPSSQDLVTFSIMNMDLGYDVVVYYANDEKGVLTYIDEIRDILPEQFEIFDSVDSLRFIFHVLENIENALNWLLIITGLIVVIFGFLIIFYILKERTYDISVFRIKGMSKAKTSILFAGEIFIVSLSAFVAAWILYITIFTQIFGFAFRLQGNITVNNDYNYFNIMNEVRGHEIFLSVNPFEFFISLFVVVVFTVIVGLAAVLFISRHEPMKTMTEI